MIAPEFLDLDEILEIHALLLDESRFFAEPI